MIQIFKTIRKILFGEKKKPDNFSKALYVGKIIDDGSIKCEVVAVYKKSFQVLIHKIYLRNAVEVRFEDVGLQSYLDEGRVYILKKHTGNGPNMKVFEINPRFMKRRTSQVLLFWFSDSGWSWEIDS